MSAGFLGFEDGQWKWQCLECGKTFLGKIGDAKGAIDSHEAAEHHMHLTGGESVANQALPTPEVSSAPKQNPVPPTRK